MKKKCLIVLVAIFLAFNLVYAQTCIDSDKGDIFNRGYVEDNGKTFDSCEKSFFLDDIEYEVKENVCINGKKETINLPCEYRCDEGKCIDKGFFIKLKDSLDSYFKRDYGIEEDIVKECAMKTSLDSLVLTGLQGGYLAPEDYVETTSTIISYGYKDGETKLISKKDLEKELEKYMDTMLEYCIDSNYKILEDLVDEKPKVDVKIKKDAVSFSVKQKVKKEGNKVSVRYNYDIPIKLGKMLGLSEDVLKGQGKKEQGIDVVMSKFDEDTDVFSITDNEFNLDRVPYVFRIAVQRFEELESKSGFLQNIFDWFGIYGGALVNPYEVEVSITEIKEKPKKQIIEPPIQPEETAVAEPSPFCTRTLLQKCEEIAYANSFSFVAPSYLSFIETPKEKLDKKRAQCYNRFDRGIEFVKDALLESQLFMPTCTLKINEQTIKRKPVPAGPYIPAISNEEVNKEIEFNIARIGTKLTVIGWRLSGEGSWIPLEETVLDFETKGKIGRGNVKILLAIGDSNGIIGDLMDGSANQLDFPRELKNNIGDRGHNDCYYYDYGDVADDYKNAITEFEYVIENCHEISDEASMAISELYTIMGSLQKSNINYRTLIKKLKETEEERTEDEIASKIDEVRLRLKIAENNLNNAGSNQKEAGSLLAESTRELNQALEQINEIIREIESELSRSPGDFVYRGLLKEATDIRDSIVGVQETPELKKEVLDLLDSRIKVSENYAEIQAIESLKEDIEGGTVKNSADVIKKYLRDHIIPETKSEINQMKEKLAHLQAKSDNAKKALPGLESELKSAKARLSIIDEERGILKTTVGIFSGPGALQTISILKNRVKETGKSVSDTKLFIDLIDKEIARLTKKIEEKDERVSKVVEGVDGLIGDKEKLQLLVLHSYDKCIAGSSDSVIGLVDEQYNLGDFDGRGYFDSPLQRLEEIFMNGNLIFAPIAIGYSYEQADNKLVELSHRQAGIMVVDSLIKNGITREFLEASDKEREDMLYEIYEKSNKGLDEKQMAEGRIRSKKYATDFRYAIARDPSLLLLIFDGDPAKLKNYFEEKQKERDEWVAANIEPSIIDYPLYYDIEDLVTAYNFQTCVDLSEFDKGLFNEVAHSLNLATLVLIMAPGAQAGSLSRVIPYATSETSLASAVVSGVRATETGTTILDGVIAGKGELGKIAARSWLLRDSGITTRFVCKAGTLGGEIFVADAFEKLTRIPHSSSAMFGFLSAWHTFDAGISKLLITRAGIRSSLKETLEDPSQQFVNVGLKEGRASYTRTLVVENQEIREELLYEMERLKIKNLKIVSEKEAEIFSKPIEGMNRDKLNAMIKAGDSIETITIVPKTGEKGFDKFAKERIKELRRIAIERTPRLEYDKPFSEGVINPIEEKVILTEAGDIVVEVCEGSL